MSRCWVQPKTLNQMRLPNPNVATNLAKLYRCQSQARRQVRKTLWLAKGMRLLYVLINWGLVIRIVWINLFK